METFFSIPTAKGEFIDFMRGKGVYSLIELEHYLEFRPHDKPHAVAKVVFGVDSDDPSIAGLFTAKCELPSSGWLERRKANRDLSKWLEEFGVIPYTEILLKREDHQ